MSTVTTPAVAATAQKFAGMRDFQEHQRGLIGRRNEMLVVQVAIVAKLHVLLHGIHGVAKSMTADGILMHLPDLAQFKTQAYKASPPEQFLGPISLERMAHDEFVRIVTGKAPRAEIFYCDEITRAPRSLLPAFQGMMVEREFDDGNGVAPVPLMSLIGTCNHIPDDPELEAFMDRFALKLIVKPPASQDEFVRILKGALRRRDTGEPAVPAETVVSRTELLDFQRAVETVRVPDDVLEAFGELWSNLLGIDVYASPRRYVDVTKAMQACAALDGRDEVLLDDLQVAQHALWTRADEAPEVYKEVVKFASEWVKTKADLLNSFADTLDRLGQVQSLVAGGADPTSHATVDDTDRSITDHGLKLVGEQRRLRGLVERHIADAQGRDTSELDAVLTQMDAAKAWVQDRLLGGLTL